MEKRRHFPSNRRRPEHHQAVIDNRLRSKASEIRLERLSAQLDLNERNSGRTKRDAVEFAIAAGGVPAGLVGALLSIAHDNTPGLVVSGVVGLVGVAANIRGVIAMRRELEAPIERR